jgi:hypothetical protein
MTEIRSHFHKTLTHDFNLRVHVAYSCDLIWAARFRSDGWDITKPLRVWQILKEPLLFFIFNSSSMRMLLCFLGIIAQRPLRFLF